MKPLGQERGAGPGLREAAVEQIVRIKIEASRWTQPCSRCIRMAPGIKKNGPQAIGKSRGGWTTKIHLVAADARTP